MWELMLLPAWGLQTPGCPFLSLDFSTCGIEFMIMISSAKHFKILLMKNAVEQIGTVSLTCIAENPSETCSRFTAGTATVPVFPLG